MRQDNINGTSLTVVALWLETLNHGLQSLDHVLHASVRVGMPWHLNRHVCNCLGSMAREDLGCNATRVCVSQRDLTRQRAG